jgi:hypothetical protein
MGPYPRGLAFDPATENLVVALGEAGVVVGQVGGGWVQSAVGGADDTEIPGPFVPVGPFPLAAWTVALVVVLLSVRLWLASSERTVPHGDGAAFATAAAAVLAVISLVGVILLTRDYPYGPSVGPGWWRAGAAPAAVGIGFLAAFGLTVRWGVRRLGPELVWIRVLTTFVLVALAAFVVGAAGAILGGYQ